MKASQMHTGEKGLRVRRMNFMRSKFAHNAFLNFDLMIDLLATRIIKTHKSINFDLLIKIKKKIQSHEKGEFQYHDHNFDLMKKLNFDLMKFDLMKFDPLPGGLRSENLSHKNTIKH